MHKDQRSDQGILEDTWKTEEGFEDNLNHKQYNKEDEVPNIRDQVWKQEYASGDVRSGQSEGLSVVLQ